MRLKRTLTLILFTTLLAIAGISHGQEAELEAFGFEKVQAEATRLAELTGSPAKVLLVFDIDNTLLAMNQDLGSDQWYDWQSSLPKHDPWKVENLLGQKLLDVQRFLYAVGSMRATDPTNQPRIVRQLQDAGFTTFLLTSRGPEMRDSTRRELLANGYDFRGSALDPGVEEPGSYSPYDKDNVAASGITQAEAEQWLTKSGAIRSPRDVSYREGIYMTAGQHKGAMLRMLLHRSGNVGKFSHVIFVDDKAKHTANVRKAFAAPTNATAVTFRYTREDANVFRFGENRCGEKNCATVAVYQLMRCQNGVNVSKTNPPQRACPQQPTTAVGCGGGAHSAISGN